MNVVHSSPSLSTVLAPSSGVSLMTLNLSVQKGSDPVSLKGLTIRAEDSNGVPANLDIALSQFTLVSGAASNNFPVVARRPPWSGPGLMVPGNGILQVQILADVIANPTAKDLESRSTPRR